MKDRLITYAFNASLVLGVTILCSWMMTQSIAHRLEYPGVLGSPWGNLGSFRLYQPYRFFVWDVLCRGLDPRGFDMLWLPFLFFIFPGIPAFTFSVTRGTWGGIGRGVLRCLLVVPGAAVALLGLWISTQAEAKLLNYQKGLGAPWFVWHRYPVYRPHAYLVWRHYFYRYAPGSFDRSASFAWFGLALGVLTSGGILVRVGRAPKEPTSHGTAHWAGREELERTGLFGAGGVMLGRAKSGKYLCHDREEHVLVLAPSRTGKGVGVIVPTLFSWAHSVVVSDIKGENWGITSGYRKRKLGNVVLRFDPTAESGSARFNPLDEVRVGTLRDVADAQNIADILVNPYGLPTGQSHWDKTGHDLLVGSILHVLYAPEIREKNLSALAQLLADPERSFDDTLHAMLTARHDPGGSYGWRTASGQPTATHPVVAAAARAMLDRAETERSGVKSTALATLSLYRDPLVARNTSRSDFSIADLMNHERPVSLYLVIPTSEVCRTRPLFRMILNMLGRKLTASLEFENGRQVVKYRHRLLLLMDEFLSFGQLDFFQTSLPLIAGYGIKSLLVAQDPEQIKSFYGEHNIILANCSVRVVFTPNDIDGAELISRSLGEQTCLVTNTSFSGERSSLWLKNKSYSTQEVARRLMTPGEIAVLPATEEIVFVAGHPPIRADKIFYYSDKSFKGCVLAAPPVSDLCRDGGSPAAVPVLEGPPRGADLRQRVEEEAAPARVPVQGGGEAETEGATEPETLPLPTAPAPQWARKLAEGRPAKAPGDPEGGVTL